MLTPKLKQQIRDSFDGAKTQLSNFSNRSSQNKMIAEISKTLMSEYPNKNPIICVEAPTGTGKTMAYLVSCLPIAKTRNKKLVIASANVALQEQILNKDIVEAKKYSSVDFEYALAKGRSRYVCIRNLINLTEENSNSPALFEDALLWDEKPTKSDLDQLSDMADSYTSTKWSGEIDDLERPPDNSLWQKIACNRFTCNSKNCEFYNDCSFFNARKKASQSDVIIANHDLVLADIINGNNVLPDVEDCIFVFDEAHHLSQKALSHFSVGGSTEFMKTSIRQFQSATDQIIKITKSKTSNNYIEKVDTAINDLSDLLTNLDYSDDVFLFPITGIPDEITNLTKQIFILFNSAYNDFYEQKELWEDYVKTYKIERATTDNLNNIIGQNNQNLSSILSLLTTFNQTPDPSKPPSSNWISCSRLTNKKNNYQLNSAKIDVSSSLDQMIWSKAAGVVLTSATLTALGSFNRLNQQLGLAPSENQYLRLASPFNHNSVEFKIAKFKASPTNTFDHTQEVALELKNRIDTKSATLVLFASNSQMQNVADVIEKSIDCELLIQGEYSKKNILERHIENRKNSKGSIIFGLDSFAEGVDLKGDNLNHVFITKLRFSVPTSPIEMTTQSYLESLNRNSFMEISLPDASLRLIQASGRLIRTETDTGTITIFDNRLVNKFYGKLLIEALPEFKVVIE
ncbi:MAG: ATP-dependent DNA helicase DinG [Thiotrichales bacterium]|jgi:ATP-dependent DNA helicase DinG|nr:ATP-dependent DNA helicase DinG [Thiotrichales bacterium]MBT7934006.1 ATP-dependent DNA helicase DinG [Thiotrichales bacterium]